MGKVYSYIRFSDARQATGASVARQRDFAQRWADEHGLALDDELSLRDEGLSAFHQRHVRKGALGVFLAAAEAGRIEADSVLLVESLDRLSRAEPLTALAQLTGIIDAGIAVVTAADRKIYTRAGLRESPMDLLHSLLVMIRAHEESATKSRRVLDAIRRQVHGWVAGTYRGLVRTGATPGWLRVVGGAWQLVPERAAAVRAAVQMAMAGLGAARIAQQLHADGLSLGAVAPTSGHLSRLLLSPALVGDKVIVLDGERYTLADYYPALLDRAGWAALQAALAQRSRKAVRGQIPSVLTGTGVTFCGYCGGPMKGQTMASKRAADGTLSDGHRRLQCSRVNSGDSCPVPGSCSAGPIERALVAYCSDLLHLQRLYQGDGAATQRAVLASAQAALDHITSQLARLTDAMLADGAEPPATFARRARELEAGLPAAQHAVQQAHAELAAAARAGAAGADARWRSLADGVAALDYGARMQARQLVVDTFSRLVVYHHGMQPDEAPAGTIDLVLQARGGGVRLLRIDRAGRWVAGDDWQPGAVSGAWP